MSLFILLFFIHNFNKVALSYGLNKENSDRAKEIEATEKISAFNVCIYQNLSKKLDNLFQEKGFGYTIQYPSDWIYSKASAYIVVFSGKEGTDAFYSTVSIQNVASTKRGGKYEDINSFITDLKDQLIAGAKNTRIYNEKTLVYEKNWIKLIGEEFITEYTRQGEHFKQWIVVVKRENGEIFYGWFYTAPKNIYNAFLPLAKAMMDSWTIIE
jgi:hypothetical protein